ncbi:MAG: cation transporter [Kiritimatiellae bacterium]|nr:cation transporter [Kiritimatiellia bacterium]
MALLSDAVHNLSDVAALIIALVARRLGRRPPSHRLACGWPMGYCRKWKLFCNRFVAGCRPDGRIHTPRWRQSLSGAEKAISWATPCLWTQALSAK